MVKRTVEPEEKVKLEPDAGSETKKPALQIRSTSLVFFLFLILILLFGTAGGSASGTPQPPCDGQN